MKAKMRIVEGDCPFRTLYNDIDFEKLNKINKIARGMYEPQEEKEKAKLVEKINVCDNV